MKKKILMMLILVVTVVSTTFAKNREGINEKVSSSFKKEFSHAEDVQLEAGKDLVKVTFKLNNQVMFAYYTETGELMAVTRNILSVQLPINLLAAIKRDYNDHWISDLFEVSGSGGSTYYITLESAEYTWVLKSGNNTEWQTYQKTKKNIE